MATFPPSDCTCPNPRSSRIGILTVTVIAITLATAWIPAQARADGDPPSDVLISQPLFLSADGAIPPHQQAELSGLVKAVDQTGYQLRVAMIATPADLGSVGELWLRPGSYAHFLALELASVYRGAVLVVMPNGIGLYRSHGLSRAERLVLTSPTASGTGPKLATLAASAVRHLAAAAGHPISAGLQQPVGTLPAEDPIVWIAYATGALMVVLAWTASLRAHQPRSGRFPYRAGDRRVER